MVYSEEMTTSNPQKYADQVNDWLLELGYTHCFFVAGGNIMHLLDGARTRFVCIPVVHEVAAGIAVEYFNESNGKGKAFAMVTAGPGVSNIITAMSGAWLESRELLVIAGQVKSEDLATGGVRQRGIQEIDGVGLTKAVSKRAIRIASPIAKAEFLEHVVDGYSERPGPIFIELCLDAQGSPPIRENSELIGDLKKTIVKNCDRSLSADAVARLKNSVRPVVLLGGGVSRECAQTFHDELISSGIPIMTTWNGMDRIGSDARNYLGRPNTWGQRAPNLLMSQADLIIAIGTRLGLQQTGFNWQEFGRNAYVIQVDIDESELKKGHPQIDLPICGDADQFLSTLLKESYTGWEDWLEYCQNVRAALPVSEEINETAKGFLNPYDFFCEISELMESTDVVIPCSSGATNSVPMQAISQKFGQIIITNKGLASMGYGLSGAIGASLAHPGRRTFLFEGDGGFAQNLQELATVAVNRLPIKIFVFANNGYGSIRMTQKNYFGGAYLGCDIETGLGFPDWNQLFRSFGINSIDIDENWKDSEEFAQAIESDQPCGFVVPIDQLQTYWPKITSRVTEGGGMESNPLHQMSPDLSEHVMREVARYL